MNAVISCWIVVSSSACNYPSYHIYVSDHLLECVLFLILSTLSEIKLVSLLACELPMCTQSLWSTADKDLSTSTMYMRCSLQSKECWNKR